MADIARDIQQLARAHQLQLHPYALRRLAEYVATLALDAASRQDVLRDVFALLRARVVRNRLVDQDAMHDAVEQHASRTQRAAEQREGVAGSSGGSRGVSAMTVQVVPLEAVPVAGVADATDQLRVLSLADVRPDRVGALRQRYLLARRRCLRSGAFARADAVSLQHEPPQQPSLTMYSDAAGKTTATADDGSGDEHHGDDDTSEMLPLLPIASLDGLGAHVRVAVLGLLCLRDADTPPSLLLEDLHSVVPLALAHTRHAQDNDDDSDENKSSKRAAPALRGASGGFLVDGLVVVVRGSWYNGVLHVSHMAAPPAEPRQRTLRDTGGSCDCFGLAPHDAAAALRAETAATQAVMVVLAHVPLDKPSTLARLALFFAKMQTRGERELAETTFVLVGSFVAVPVSYDDVSHLPDVQTHTEHMRALFDALGKCIATHAPAAAAHSHFVLVPGPLDVCVLQGCLPQPPLARHFVKGLAGRVKSLSLAPNPCRLRYHTQELVVVRRDYLRALQASERRLRRCLSVVDKASDSSGDNDGDGSTTATYTSFERVTKTLLDEAHLAPEMRGGVLWKMDHALRLPVLPHTLFVCDATEQWECYYKGTHVVNPGSFDVASTFVWYTLADRECSVNAVE